MSARLAVWMNGERVGVWSVDRAAHRFEYAAGWLQSPRRRSLSLSMPLTPTREVRGPAVGHYFDNLLPDNEAIRQRVARRWRTGSTEAFPLLEAIGRDCVGAVQLLPDDAEPAGWDRIAAEPLDEAAVAALLRGVPADPVIGRGVDADDFRISLAGAQEKTALLLDAGRWCRPRGATPTTHILKLPLGLVGGSRRVDLGDSVENEWLCSRVLHRLGLPVAETAIARFEDQKALVVTRFDRARRARPDGGGDWIARLPQEDLCQALGLPSSRKYEKDGGPGITAAMRLLDASRDPADRSTFALTQLAFWLLAATDGHAKNFSIFLLPGDAYRLTPLYDVLSIFPYVGDAPDRFRWRKAELAMALRSRNAHYALHGIEARHWRALATAHGGAALWQAMVALAERTPAVLDAVGAELPPAFPETTWRAIRDGARRQARRFLDGVAAGAG